MTVDKHESNSPIASGREGFLEQELAGRLYIFPILEDNFRNPVLFDIIVQAAGTQEQKTIYDSYLRKVDFC